VALSLIGRQAHTRLQNASIHTSEEACRRPQIEQVHEIEAPAGVNGFERDATDAVSIEQRMPKSKTSTRCTFS
jgi:hypothetical protein